MPIFYIQLFNVTLDNPVPISFAYDFSSLPLLARYSTSTTEMFAFLAKTFISNTKVGYRQGCSEDDYYGWAYIDSDRLGGVVMTDIEYDRRVSFSLLDRVMREYKESERNWDWTTIKDPIIDIKKYTVAVSGYLATGGDGYLIFTKGRLINNEIPFQDALYDEFKTQKFITNPGFSRLVDISD